MLIVNTNGIPQTGEFLDHILEEKNPVRIQYTDDKHNEFIIKINELTKSDKKFDLICLDPYHTYDISLTDYNLLTPLLSDNGIIISHDCYPPEYRYIPTINPDSSINRVWCGETYVAFVKFSEENPHLFYAVIKYDVGLGIISKTQIQFVKKNNNQ